MIQQQLVERGIDDLRVLAAIRSVPREFFFAADTRAQAHADRAAPIGHGQTISQPYMVALMTQRLDVQPGQRILEIGTGSGYQTAVLAHLAGVVYSMERVKPLLDEAFDRLMSLGVRNIHLRHGDGSIGWPEAAPFERILITAGARELPTHLLLTQLQDNGIAVLPVGDIQEQVLVEVRRRGDVLQRTDICPCRFVKLIGQAGWSE
jgi:protein-L-isoaspartate(D-aspartate) O-methyltransferase